MRRVPTVIAALAATASLAAPASAMPPTHEHSSFGIDTPFESDITCDGRPVMQTFHVERRVSRFYDDAGNVVRMVRHATITGTLANADFTAQVPLWGRVHVVDNFETGEHTVTGQRLVVELPGPDARLAGRAVFDLDTQELIKETGLSTIERRLCPYLYG